MVTWRNSAAKLRKRGLVETRIVEEARGHLTDAAEQAASRGLGADLAEREAITRFGPPDVVAANFAAERYRMMNRTLLVAAVLVGLAIAYVDSRPTWDDAGITAFSMLLAAGLFGLIAPRRPWLWALAVGIWVPAYAIARADSPAAFGMLLVLAFPFAGAYLGFGVRRLLAPMISSFGGFRP